LVVLDGMTVVGFEGSQVVLRDGEGEVIQVERDKVFASLREAQQALGCTDAVYFRDGPVHDGWHRNEEGG
jgi:hypothetical protein